MLPEHGKQLGTIEKQLRKPLFDEHAGLDTGEYIMKNEAAHRWNTESLFNALNDRPAYNGNHRTIEIIDGIDSSIVIGMHDYGDLPVFISVGGEQILVESVLFSVDDVEDTAKFNEYVLKTHKYLPLSTISIENDSEHGDYYHMFGALSASSSISEIVHEIDTLAENVIQATEAFKTFLKF